MKRILNYLLIFVITIFVFSLSSCHGSKALEPFNVPAEFDASKTYEISFWAKNDSNLQQKKIYQKAIDEFQKIYPNIKVTLRSYTDYKKIYNDVITNISTKTTPNVCITYPDHIAKYITGSNIVAPLDELIVNQKYGLGGTEVKFESVKKEDIVSSFLDELKIDGVLYGVPFMRSTEALYINKTYVEELGYEVPDIVTWDFVFNVSKEAASLKKNKEEVFIPFIYKSTDNMMIQMLKQLNAPYSKDDGEIELFNDTTKEILFDIADLTENGGFSTFKISSYPANFLNAGQCIFAIDSTAGATWMGSHAPLLDIPEEDIVEFETVVRPVPQFDTSNVQMISQGPSLCIFNKEDNNEVLASWLFVEYLLTNGIQIDYSETEGYIPVTHKALNSIEYNDYLSKMGELSLDSKGELNNSNYYDIKILASKLLIDNLDNTFTTPVFNGSSSLREASGELIEQVTKYVRRGGSIDDEFIEDTFSQVYQLYRLDQVTKTQTSSTLNRDLGKLPLSSIILLISLGVTIIFIASYYIIDFFKKQKNK